MHDVFRILLFAWSFLVKNEAEHSIWLVCWESTVVELSIAEHDSLALCPALFTKNFISDGRACSWVANHNVDHHRGASGGKVADFAVHLLD